MKKLFIILLLLNFSCSKNQIGDTSKDLVLWYKQPASRWMESLPIGNGRLGAVVFGGINREKIGLNISTLWSGAPSNTNESQTGAAHLQQIRQVLFNDEYGKAEALINEHMLGNKDSYGTHLPLADLNIDFYHISDSIQNYHRELDIETAVSLVEYDVNGTHFTRKMFASNPDNLIVMCFSSDKPGQLSFSLQLDFGALPHEIIIDDQKTVRFNGKAWEKIHSDGLTGVDFAGQISVYETNGKTQVADGKLTVKGADRATLLFAANTSFCQQDPAGVSKRQVEAVSGKTFKEMLRSHIADHQLLFNRVSLNLGRSELDDLPTDERLKALVDHPDDPGLYALFYQYGRYMLIASSRENSPLPANLQGLWNDNFACVMPWTCDFHLDINTQQNYWPAESGNLTECNEPLFKLIEGLVEPGRRTAKRLYNAKGWVAHVVTNAWGYTAPGWGLGWGLHTTGGIWLASHLWDHYEYTGDLGFLKERAYPVLKEAAIFYMDYMTRHPESGWLVTGPSLSPENKFLTEEGGVFSETMGPTCDAVLIRDLFTCCIKASKILEGDEKFGNELEEALTDLPPLQIGKYGQLQEWLVDWDDAVPNHRHTSHLIALYPSSQITYDATPALAKAASVTLERRTGQTDWEDVEWSRGNLINFYARLREKQKAYENLHGMLTDNTDLNLMTYSRGGIAGAVQNIFVMDGNTSGTNGISEMLMQCYDHTIYLLPALPEAWATGEVHGLCAKDGFEVDISWEGGGLKEAVLMSEVAAPCHIKYGDREIEFFTETGRSYRLDGTLKCEISVN